MSNIEKKVVFVIAAAADGVPTIMLGITRQCFEDIQGGLCSDFDMTKAGINLRGMVFGAESHEEIMKMIESMASQEGIPVLDERRRDFSIDIDHRNRKK